MNRARGAWRLLALENQGGSSWLQRSARWPKTVNRYYKAEADPRPARTCWWKPVEEVELATLEWAHWYND